jgi:glucose/arabinose dehydrogenase
MPDPVRSLALGAAIVLVAACGGGGDGPATLPPPQQPPPPPPSVTLAVERAFAGVTFTRPVAMLQRPGDTTRWYVVQQDGLVRTFPNDPAVSAAQVTTFVDLSSIVTSPADGGGLDEMGLLGMAFHPDFAANGRVFVSYTATPAGIVSRISEFRSGDGGLTIDTGTAERIVLSVNQPQGETNHKGGNIAFGDDTFLYVGLGDGGGGGDNHGAIGNGQLLTTLLGKMLRIDVSPTTGYQIPPTNPFATRPQCVNGTAPSGQECPEIFASGFRNPWRWSFDRTTDELWVADVGQNAFEEAGPVRLGGNYGWRCREASRPFSNTCGPALPADLINPTVEYSLPGSQSITGGYVYRGTAIPNLVGRYVFGDFVGGNIWHIARDTAPTLDVTNTTASAPMIDTAFQISAFAEGTDGELYVLDYGGGTIQRIRQAP